MFTTNNKSYLTHAKVDMMMALAKIQEKYKLTHEDVLVIIGFALMQVGEDEENNK